MDPRRLRRPLRVRLGAPILLVAARLLQGPSVGGEFGSSATYLSEIATPGRRGFYSSFQYVSIVLGQLLALVVLILPQQVLTEPQMYSWGWRVPFFIGAAASFVVLHLRRTMDESTHFEAEVAAEHAAVESGRKIRKGLNALVREYPTQLFVVFARTANPCVAFLLLLVAMVFLTAYTGCVVLTGVAVLLVKSPRGPRPWTRCRPRAPSSRPLTAGDGRTRG